VRGFGFADTDSKGVDFVDYERGGFFVAEGELILAGKLVIVNRQLPEVASFLADVVRATWGWRTWESEFCFSF